MMSLRVACQMPEVAAIAAVAGGLPVRWKDDCKPVCPISVLGIDGTADPIVPYNGDVLSVADTSAAFQVWRGCADGTSIAFVTVEGGGHGWPGGRQYFSGSFSRHTRSRRTCFETLRSSA